MRMTDTLDGYALDPKEYKNHPTLSTYIPAIDKVSGVTKVPATRWRVFDDGQQKSTIAAGKSSCVFLAADFDTLDQAVAVMQALHSELPTVNVDMHLTPDGKLDQGDGAGSFDRGWRQSGYIREKGFGVSILVDLQNVNRHLKATQDLGSPQRPAQRTDSQFPELRS